MLFETHFATPLSLLLCTFRSRALHVPELSSSKVKPQFWDACRTKGTWKRYSRCCGYHLGSQSTISSSTSATCTPANSHSAVNEYYNLVSQISQHYGVNEQVSKCWAHSKVFTPALVAILLYHSLIPRPCLAPHLARTCIYRFQYNMWYWNWSTLGLVWGLGPRLSLITQVTEQNKQPN